MARERALAAADASVVLTHPFVASAVLSDYWRLTKPEVNFLIAVTTAAGFYLGCSAVAVPCSVDPVPAHASRHPPRRERSGGSQSMDGVPVRCKDAPDGSTGDRRRAHRSEARADVRSVLVAGGPGVPAARRRCPAVAPCARDPRRLLVHLHATETRSRRCARSLVRFLALYRPSSVGRRRAGAWTEKHGSSSASCSCGSFRTSCRSPGCTATTMLAPGISCCLTVPCECASRPCKRSCRSSFCCP